MTEPETAVHRTVTVGTSIERAFAVFTENFADWWPKEYYIGLDPLETAVIEPREGGIAEGPTSTRVELTHTGFREPNTVYTAFNSRHGWTGILTTYSTLTEAAHP